MRDESYGIPKIIHQTWKTSEIPSSQSHAVASWQDLNPDYDYHLYTDNEMDAYMRKHHPELIEAWNAMKAIERADTFRYSLNNRRHTRSMSIIFAMVSSCIYTIIILLTFDGIQLFVGTPSYTILGDTTLTLMWYV